ncbi:hypothetical protein [Yokenella regensburgei]|uniref:hypothetical protein n=1 Tax=Yokenella regensburgei TaxID=158877 RepID=UPI003ED9E248
MADGIAFTKDYKEKFKVSPGSYALLAYTGVYVFAQAMQEARPTVPGEFMPMMPKFSYGGKIQGNVELNAKGDIKDGAVVVFEAAKGVFTERKNLN